MTGRVVGLFVAPEAGAPPESRTGVRVVDGGIAGDRYCRGAGHFSRVGDGHPITLVAARAVGDAERTVDAALAPGWHRRNVVVDAEDLDAARGAALAVGDARLRVTRDRPPCAHLEATLGGADVADALRGRAGVCADVDDPGAVAVGDAVRVAAPSPREAGRQIAERLRRD
ncbi:MAG: MOSC domain-containing protein [Haloferacaceae archaeon]